MSSVRYSEFLRVTNEQQKEFAQRGEAVNAMYSLMSQYFVAVPDPDIASVRMMETSLGQVTHLVAQVEAAQEERTNQFTEDIETSIASLRTASDELRAESEDKMLFDGKTDMIEALGKLDYLDSAFQTLKADSERYAYYQEILKVPVTRWLRSRRTSQPH